ncbi:MAG: energy transducer TonB, partial [Arthrospira sp. PLM2.Bin9]
MDEELFTTVFLEDDELQEISDDFEAETPFLLPIETVDDAAEVEITTTATAEIEITTTAAPVNPLSDVVNLRDFIIEQLFDEEVYLAQNPDLAQFKLELEAAGFEFNLREHFREFGKFEGREFSAFFSVTRYLEKNTDISLVINREEAFSHFLDFGLNEGREFSDFFSASFYAEANPDLAAITQETLVSKFAHFLGFGQFENRRCSRVFDANTYLQLNPDVSQFLQESANQGLQISAFSHFITRGRTENRQFSNIFNVSEYLQLNPDLVPFVESGQINAVDHWVRFGLVERREFSLSFTVSQVLRTLSLSSLTEINISELFAQIESNLALIIGSDD